MKLTMTYQMSVVTAVERWADWAEAEVQSWDTTAAPPTADLDTFRRVLEGWAPLLTAALSREAGDLA